MSVLERMRRRRTGKIVRVGRVMQIRTGCGVWMDYRGWLFSSYDGGERRWVWKRRVLERNRFGRLVELSSDYL